VRGVGGGLGVGLKRRVELLLRVGVLVEEVVERLEDDPAATVTLLLLMRGESLTRRVARGPNLEDDGDRRASLLRGENLTRRVASR
jgi:hypothetical protein